MSSKIGSAYVVYEDLTGRGYIRLDFDKAAFVKNVIVGGDQEMDHIAVMQLLAMRKLKIITAGDH